MDITPLAKAIAALAAALTTFGGALGLARVGEKALDAIARQPEEKKDIRTNMMLIAAFIEGLAFFTAIIALLVILL
jgi:F-type H+-transporting ATPase subunit c